MSNGVIVRIGTWIEKESREINRCPSYYAADHETLKTVAGEYPAELEFVGGYTVPMPYWLLVGIPADRIDGRLYSGFAGVNFASTELPKKRVTYHLQSYHYQIPELVEQGWLKLDPAFEWLLVKHYAWQEPGAPKDWDAVIAIRDSQKAAAVQG